MDQSMVTFKVTLSLFQFLFLQTLCCYKDCRWSANSSFKEDVNWCNSDLESISKLSRCLWTFPGPSPVWSVTFKFTGEQFIFHGSRSIKKVKARGMLFGHMLWIKPSYHLCYPEKKVTYHDSHYTSHLDCFLLCGTNPNIH